MAFRMIFQNPHRDVAQEGGLAVRGGATIKPRCPLPMGQKRSMHRLVIRGVFRFQGSVFSRGVIEVRLENSKQYLRFSGSKPSMVRDISYLRVRMRHLPIFYCAPESRHWSGNRWIRRLCRVSTQLHPRICTKPAPALDLRSLATNFVRIDAGYESSMRS